MQILTVSGLQKTYTTRFGGSKVQALKNVKVGLMADIAGWTVHPPFPAAQG